MAEYLKFNVPGFSDAGTQGAFAAILIIFGVVVKNSIEQLKMGDSMLGVAAFVVGWLLFANAVATSPNNAGTTEVGTDLNALLPYVAAAAIVFAVFGMKKVKKGSASTADKQKRMMPYVIGFVVGWLLLGYSINASPVLTACSVAIILLSMIFFMPRQRKNCIVDGPGLPMFVLGWLGMVFANSPSSLDFLKSIG